MDGRPSPEKAPQDDWAADDESALVRRHNTVQSKSAATLVFGGLLGKTSDPTDDPDVDTSESVEISASVEVSQPPPPAGLMGSLREWWTTRQMEVNKDFGMDPYVQCKLGRYGKIARTEAYLSVKEDDPEVYLNPKYTDEHRNELTVERSGGDRGELLVEVFDEGLEKDRFIGACHVHLTPFIKHAERSDSWKHTMFHLYDHQDVGDDEDQRDAGGVHALVRWVPELAGGEGAAWAADADGRAQGVLKVKVLAGTDLRDVSSVRISDITSFADTGSFQLTLYLMVFFIIGFALFYRYVVWGELVNTDDTTLFTDSMLFVLTTFTTVGYGDHPQLLETTFERLVTVVFIILGIGILGVTIGTWGDMFKVKMDQKKRRTRERLLKKMQDKGIDTSKLAGSDDIKEQVMKNLKDKFDESEIDEHLIQTEMGRALIKRFWVDEIKKMLLGVVGLVAILALGTGVFFITEKEHCFVSDKTDANADLGCKDMNQYMPDSIADNPRWKELKQPGRTAKGLRIIDALYFTTVTASTVGYGDVTPQSFIGKLFAIVYIPIAVALMSKTIMSIALIPMEYRHLKLEAYVLDQFGDELSAPDFADLKSSVNVGPDESIRKNDFTLAMLLRLGRIGKYDITRIEQIFARLDKDKTGVLDKKDVKDLLELQKLRHAKHVGEDGEVEEEDSQDEDDPLPEEEETEAGAAGKDEAAGEEGQEGESGDGAEAVAADEELEAAAVKIQATIRGQQARAGLAEGPSSTDDT